MSPQSPDFVLKPPPPRPDEAHKGTFGTVIVVGGSVTMPAAPAIVARAAFRSGVGLVKIAAESSVMTTAITLEPSATGIVLPPDNLDAQGRAIEHADPQQRAILVIGPGMGQSQSAAHLLELLLSGPRAVVLDADGLNLLAQSSGLTPQASSLPLILTPHPGEYHRLATRLAIAHDPTDPQQRPAAAMALAQACNAVVILKGHHTVIANPTASYINPTGNPALATAGSGDVLSGVVAALLAQGMSPLHAAVLATHVHGRAADLWAKTHSRRGMLARELADLLPAALLDVEKN